MSWILRGGGRALPTGCDFEYQGLETAVEVAYAFLGRTIVEQVLISHQLFDDVNVVLKKGDSSTPEQTLSYLKRALRARTEAEPR